MLYVYTLYIKIYIVYIYTHAQYMFLYISIYTHTMFLRKTLQLSRILNSLLHPHVPCPKDASSALLCFIRAHTHTTYRIFDFEYVSEEEVQRKFDPGQYTCSRHASKIKEDFDWIDQCIRKYASRPGSGLKVHTYTPNSVRLECCLCLVLT